jgi:uncharacterized protein (TIGR03435 family)
MRSLPLLLATLALAQASDLHFDVASVKVAGQITNGPGVRGGPGSTDPGRITYTRATLTDLIMRAYDVWTDQVSGPAWTKERTPDTVFAITATMPPTTTTEQFREMLRNLLAERFHLVFHREKQTRPGYQLVVAPGGPKFKAVDPAAKAAPPNFDALAKSQYSGSSRSYGRMTMASFCRGLGADITAANGTYGGPMPRVVDKTGLTGTYEITLEFAADFGFRPADAAAREASIAPNLFNAVEDQLGLKLRRVKDVEVEVLIVDRADRSPSEN